MVLRGLVTGLGLVIGLQAGCHRGNHEDNAVEAPQVTYQTPVMLATAGQSFASVAPEAQAYIHNQGVGTIVSTGITFSVSPGLPAGLGLDPATGVISGTPEAVAATAPYVVTAANRGGQGTFTVQLGVQATSPVTLSYNGAGAAAGAVGSFLTLYPPAVSGGTATGFGVSPALPAGLVLAAGTGLVSGTPTGALGATTFTLTATTPSGSANAPFVLLVAATPAPAPVGLACPDLVATSGQPFTGPLPTLTSGTDLVYTIAPALPAGLSLDPLTGQVAGTPAASSAQAPYVLTAANALGSAQVTLQVTVN
jgi:hypothetical protein